MKIELIDTDEFVNINKLRDVTSPVLFQRGEKPHPDGLLSLEIFGMTPKDRRENFAYIKLSQHFFQPHIYKIIKRFFRNVEDIVNGTEYYYIDNKGHLVKTEDLDVGHTGIQFLYDNWEKIKWAKTDSPARNERIDVVTKSKKSQIFLDKEIVIPAFYRDVTSSSGGGGSTQEINTLYSKLIRVSSILKERDTLGFPLYHTQFMVQGLLVNIYDYFKEKLESKNGLLRKYLMGKNTDYCTRTVITGPVYHANRPEELQVNMRYTGVPVHQILSLCHPYMMKYVKDFFERELIENKDSKNVMNPKTGNLIGAVELDNPQGYFTDKFIKKKMDAFIKNPDSRFDPIEVPLVGGKIGYMVFHGRRYQEGSKDELATITTRKMTWTDLFYMAAEDSVEGKHCLVTRYPILDQYGVFVSRVTVVATSATVPMQVGEKLYKWYPLVEPDLPKSRIAAKFVDSMRFSNSYLPGLDGDFDGDQTTCKIFWLQESNDECERIMNEKAYFLNLSGSLIRKVEIEVIQTFFNMTKESTKKFRDITVAEKVELKNLKPDDLTFEKLTDLFGIKYAGPGKPDKVRFYPEDRMVLLPDEWFGNKEKINTTVGRYIVNKMLIEKPGFQNVIPYLNYEVTEGAFFGQFEQKVADALLLDKITVPQMYIYVDTRDWFGMQMHAMVTPSFTPDTCFIHPEVQKLKDELFKKYKEQLKEGNPALAAEIEKQLIAKTKEVLKDDPGMDLYNSGARGSMGNNYKNMSLMRGAVYNRATGKYEVVKNSLNDGLAPTDIPISANTILEGAYPKACGTAESGYIAKKLLASCQSEVLGEPGSDCGTKRGISLNLTASAAKNYYYRYIIDNKKTVLLTPDNISKYIGKTVELRSPMSCIRTNDCICNKCGGEFYYMIGSRQIGLTASRIGNSLTKLNMKKFHDNVVKFTKVDIDDMFF